MEEGRQLQLEEAGAPDKEREYKLWAERLICEVQDETTRKSPTAFVQAWIRWKDLAAFLSYMELWMHRNEPDGSALSSHRSLLAALLVLGKNLREWAGTLDSATLSLAGYDSRRLDTLTQTLRDSWDLWHGESNPQHIRKLAAFLPDASEA